MDGFSGGKWQHAHTEDYNSVTVANALIVNGDQAIKIWRHVHVYI